MVEVLTCNVVLALGNLCRRTRRVNAISTPERSICLQRVAPSGGKAAQVVHPVLYLHFFRVISHYIVPPPSNSRSRTQQVAPCSFGVYFLPERIHWTTWLTANPPFLAVPILLLIVPSIRATTMPPPLHTLLQASTITLPLVPLMPYILGPTTTPQPIVILNWATTAPFLTHQTTAPAFNWIYRNRRFNRSRSISVPPLVDVARRLTRALGNDQHPSSPSNPSKTYVDRAASHAG